MKRQEKLVLIDGNALVHRAFHALPPLSQKGEPTNAVYGFASVLLKMIYDLKPDYMIATFDLPAPTFRHNEFAEYKAHRPKTPDELVSQFPKVKEVVRALNIPIYEMAGFEADDIICTIAEKLKQQPDIQCIIITGDLDTLQLVDDKHTIVYTLKKGISDTVIYDEKAVLDRFEGLKPSQFNDFKGLKGDPSDNIPGVPGIGEKTAIKLLLEYGSIEEIYDNIALIPRKLSDKLSEYKDQAFFSKKLATMRKDVPIEFDFTQAKFGDYDIKKVEDVFRKFGFATLIHRLKAELAPEIKKEIIADLVVASAIASSGDIATIKKSSIVALSVSNEAVLVAIDSARIYECSFTNIKEVLENNQIRKIGYDLKKSYKELKRKNILLRGVYFDVGIAAHLASSDSANYSPTNVMRYEFKRDTVPEELAHYEPICAFAVFEKLEEALKKEGMNKLFSEIEMPLVPILAEMELFGVRVNQDKLSKLSLLLEKEKEKLQKNIYNLAGEEFNIDSPAQLSKILFEKLAIIKANKTKKTKTGIFTTKAEALEQLKGAHPIVPLVLEYRELAKLKSTYADALVEHIGGDGRTHTTYSQISTATGRLASSNPNMQNIPQRGTYAQAMREVFVSDNRFKFVAFDFSQIELRIIASLSGDEKMMDIFATGGDIHRATAAVLNHISPDEVTVEMRNSAKALNFGILYGMGYRSFSDTAGIDARTAKLFIEEYFRDFKGIAEFIQRIKKDALERGFAETLLGRKRWLPDIVSSNAFLRSSAERMAQNMPIQGLQADIIKIAMILIDREILSQEKGARMLLQIHDELIFEIRDDLVDSLSLKIKSIMELCYTLKVPIVVNVKVGGDLGSMKSYA